MAPPELPPGYTEVVRAHHKDTVGFLLALEEACQPIRDEELRRVRRTLRAVELADLPAFRPQESWLLAVLAGPLSDVKAVVQWAKGRPPAEAERVFFYYLPRARPAAVLGPWLDAGLGSPPAFAVHDFASFHKVFGRHLNDRVWIDHA